MTTRRPILLAPVILTVVALVAACSEQTPPAATPAAAPAADAAPRPIQQIFDYRLIESESGVRQWILQSEEMQKFAGQRDVLLVEVHMDFYREGEHFSVLTADSGRANVKTKQVHAWGDVVVVTDDGRRLECEDLHFDDVSGRIHNDVFNRFTRGVDVMTGYGLEATPDLEYIELKRDVKAAVTDTTDLVEPAAADTGREGGQQ